MIEFRIIKKSPKSRARLGILKTSHGEVETPTLVPVATQAVIKTLNSEEVLATESQILICNTFHLHLKPGENLIKKSGGLHKFMNWPRLLMSDSAGFQIFSLGFGRDFGTGKIIGKKSSALSNSRELENVEIKIGINSRPKDLMITAGGVCFNSPVDGRKIFIGPKESVKIQEALGADIIFAFDECTSPLADYEYTKNSLVRTHNWARICLAAKQSGQALFGIIQGGKFKDLRTKSARFIGRLPFDGFGIGGEFGDDKKIMIQMIDWVIKELPPKKPVHLLGIGHPEDILKIIKAGVDTFDCTLPTHYGRHGVAFTVEGRLDLMKSKFLKDQKPLDGKCSCFVCASYGRNYIAHLFRAKEMTGMKLLTFHNLYFFNRLVENLREGIRLGKI